MAHRDRHRARTGPVVGLAEVPGTVSPAVSDLHRRCARQGELPDLDRGPGGKPGPRRKGRQGGSLAPFTVSVRELLRNELNISENRGRDTIVAPFQSICSMRSSPKPGPRPIVRTGYAQGVCTRAAAKASSGVIQAEMKWRRTSQERPERLRLPPLDVPRSDQSFAEYTPKTGPRRADVETGGDRATADEPDLASMSSRWPGPKNRARAGRAAARRPDDRGPRHDHVPRP